jgi:phosphoheptose isomerase
VVVGNGSSAVAVQRLNSEFVGRFRDERARLSATVLYADTLGTWP